MLRFFALLILLGSIGVTGCQIAPEAETSDSLSPETGERGDNRHIAIGSVSCGGSGCHGQAVSAGKTGTIENLAQLANINAWKSSKSHWQLRDPHSKSYETLMGQLSADMMLKLYPGDEKQAWKEETCLACHSNPTLAKVPDNPLISEGVSCEACHGNADSYRTEHLKWGVKTDREEKYRDFGMNFLYKQEIRAAQCMKCHVGAPEENGIPARNVNHDMIAAGHPRLNFEYTSYLRALPPHWAEKDRAKGSKIVEVDELTLWIVGQMESTKADKSLKAYRANRTPKPELADYNCYACHHALGSSIARPDSIGELVKDEQFGNHRDPKQRLMQEPVGYLEWNEAQQRYLGLVAWFHSRKDHPNRVHIAELLNELRDQLHLERKPNSAVNSPRDYRPEEARKTILQILELMK